MRIGLLPLGRATFDVAFAEVKLSLMLKSLDASGFETVGPRDLLFDGDATTAAIDTLKGEAIDQLLILQVTFTDASMTVAAANALPVPLSIWAVPEPRHGGRLRLNSFCGLNLASHALGRNGRNFSWLYADPETVAASDIDDMLAGRRRAGQLTAAKGGHPTEEAEAIVGRIAGRRIGRIGAHPDGFDTCAYDPKALRALAGIEVDALELDQLFALARATNAAPVAALRAEVAGQITDLDTQDQDKLDRSLRLKLGLDKLRRDGRYHAFAIRCWPETFTEYGGAICGPVAIEGEARVPCACEADVYGALTQMILSEASGQPVFLTDLVDMDATDDSGVVWHCGQAPLSMAAASHPPRATVHSNRKMPLLYEFPLKPGRITLMRVSQSFGAPKMVLSGAEMLDRPMAFTGTSGVMRFDRPAGEVLTDIIDSGLEHHMALTYGEHRPLLRSIAAALDLPVLEI
ncbi:L-fucose/L-arabinose isomerase family protein [Pseudoruegeria sp. HB172150]|uniref:L-fucose/L-arabinose isomerase family protein n=1 Tax=Pseudoruegeria sp. HB172150 TaxID=2721164 RepID=UPI0015582FFA|nr:hypothetical protein [Pseudoruegeria sp. HB172150]